MTALIKYLDLGILKIFGGGSTAPFDPPTCIRLWPSTNPSNFWISGCHYNILSNSNPFRLCHVSTVPAQLDIPLEPPKYPRSLLLLWKLSRFCDSIYNQYNLTFSQESQHCFRHKVSHCWNQRSSMIPSLMHLHSIQKYRNPMGKWRTTVINVHCEANKLDFCAI